MTTRARASQATGIEVGASSGPEGQRADRRARSVPVGRMPLAAGASMNPAAVLALQRLGGNRAVTSMLAGQAAPEESAAGSVDERLEREADGAASQSARRLPRCHRLPRRRPRRGRESRSSRRCAPPPSGTSAGTSQVSGSMMTRIAPSRSDVPVHGR